MQTLCERGFERGIERDEILLDAIRAWLSVVKTQEHRSLSVGATKKYVVTFSTRFQHAQMKFWGVERS